MPDPESRIPNPESSPRLVFLGPPGSGKGTAASWTAQRLKVHHVSTGAMFREEMAAESALGGLVGPYLERGQLVPDATVMQAVAQWLRKRGGAGFVFDGFPRTLRQGELFQQLLADLGLRLDRVIYLTASRAMVEERILGRLVCDGCGRSYHARRYPPKREGHCDFCGARLTARQDDNLETLDRRWRVYEEQTTGLVDFYRRAGLLCEVSAEGSSSEMCERVWEALVS